MDTINDRLANILLVEKGLTPYRVGKDIGTSTQNIDNWLKDKKVMPGADWVAKICNEYKISPQYALFGTGNKYTNIVTSMTDSDLVSELMSKTQKLEAVKANIKAIQIILDSEAVPGMKIYKKEETVKTKK